MRHLSLGIAAVTLVISGLVACQGAATSVPSQAGSIVPTARATSQAVVRPAVADGCSVPAIPAGPKSGGPVAMRGQPVYPPILSTGSHQLSSVADPMANGLGPITPKHLPAGLASRLVLFDRANSADPGSAAATDELRIYYAKAPIDESMTIMDLYASGGGVLMNRPLPVRTPNMS